MVTVATWNVNSIKARLPRVTEWLTEFSPDIALLQELKTTDEGFPRLEIESLGYHVETSGQKTYNGVAILSKEPMEVITRALPGADDDEQARYIEAKIKNLRVASIYLPNGNPTIGEDGGDHPKFTYKLGWMDRLIAHTEGLLKTEDAFVLGGDYNVCPEDRDCYSPERFVDDALCKPQSRAKFRTLCHLGLTEAFRALHPGPVAYSYWDYQGGAWPKDNGVRIDHFLLSPQAADRLEACEIDKGPRGKEKASDHTPVWCQLSDT